MNQILADTVLLHLFSKQEWHKPFGLRHIGSIRFAKETDALGFVRVSRRKKK